MLLDHDVMAERKPETGSFPRRLGREERVEYLVSDLRRHPCAIIADSDFHLAAEVFRCYRKRGLVAIAICSRFPLARGVKAVRDQVE